MIQINNNAWNDRPVPYGVKALQCLKNNKDTSLEIKLVDMLCEYSWYVLKVLMFLFIMALKRRRYQRPTGKVFRVIPLNTCRPVQFLKLVSRRIDQLAVTLRQRGVSTPLLRMNLKLSTTPVRWLWVKFYYVVIAILASPFTVLSTSPTMKVGRAY